MTQYEGGDSEVSLADSALPAKVDELAVPLPLDTIRPWHKPRKQYIRERQWKYYTEHLIQALKNRHAFNVGETLNYLSLPGIDYFDVEVLAKVAIDANLKLETLGFLAEAEKKPVSARALVREDSLIKKGLIGDKSATVPYRIQDIVNENGQAYREVLERAPFHIINIDACGSIAPPSTGQSNRIITALHQLVGLQLNLMRNPWLLFVTTNVQPDNLNCQVRSQLEEVIKNNADDSEDFRRAAINCLGGANSSDLEDAIKYARNSLKFHSLFSLGFSKWLLRNAKCVDWDVKCLQFYGYSTLSDTKHISMPCLAYEFMPRPVGYTDRAEIVESPTTGPAVGTDYSMRAITRTQEMENIDLLFTQDPAMRTEYAKKQRDLLENAGYQAAALKEFASEYINTAPSTE
ncbi:MAG: hypothetical protein F4Z16_06515 [Rhodothermaceae bacterium]|nr:hypothetical protein [Rhodothermaceae bacterium]MYD66863.1 hypothetical protein [Rhodothermaceae bacterium]MYI78142.1 hypothetical protein [Gammaproteobacteria bacterium]